MNYDQLYSLLDKDNIDLATLRALTEEEHVSKIDAKGSDRWDYNRYDVTLDNGELYIVHVKKPISELLKIILHREKRGHAG